jgi:hypothetical protein
MDLHPIRATTAIRHLTIIYTGATKKGLAQEAAAIYEPRFAGFFSCVYWRTAHADESRHVTIFQFIVGVE